MLNVLEPILDPEKQENSPRSPFVLRCWEFTKVILAAMGIAALGMVAAAGALGQKQLLEVKKHSLERENERLRQGIKILERELTALRENPRAVEKAAVSKLGMARPDEKVYLFESNFSSNGNQRAKRRELSVRVKGP